MFGRSSFPSFFDDDPFFRDPFGHFDSVFAGFSNDPFFSPHSTRQAVPGQRSNTVVEELDGEPNIRARSDGTQPIVEEPDDEYLDIRQQQQQQQQQRIGLPSNTTLQTRRTAPTAPFSAFGNMGGATVFSVSSSTSYANGPGGFYSSSTTTRLGPGGVRETQQTVQDSRTGQQKITVTRGIGEKARTVERVKTANGQETTNDILSHIAPEEASSFDRQWMEQAQRALPPNPFSRSLNSVQSSRLQTPALMGPNGPGAAPSYHSQSSMTGSRMGTPSGRGFNP